MDVELADERVILFADRFNLDHAEGRAWSKRTEAFGAVARLGGLFTGPGDDKYTCVYRERRLQPFWRVHSRTVAAYERTRTYVVPVGPEVRNVRIKDETFGVDAQRFQVTGLESCREESERDALFDGLTRVESPALSGYLRFPAAPTTAETLAELARSGTVVVPPVAKASAHVREVVASAIGRIEADRFLEERVVVDLVDLCYRPVYAFRYTHAGKDAVIEFDALTGDTRPGGATFEQYLGKVLEPKFLLDVGVEAVDLFLPGANLARMVVQHGVKHYQERKPGR